MRRLVRHLLLTAMLCVVLGCSSDAQVEDHSSIAADTGETSAPGEDADAGNIADADTNAAQEESVGRWESTRGPFGGIYVVTRVFDTVYLHGTSRHSTDIAAVSTDNGASWSAPGADEPTSDPARKTTLVYQTSSRGAYLVDYPKLYHRASAEADWELVNPDLPGFYDFHATGDILVMLVDWQHAHGIVVSEDHGRTWEVRMGESMSEATGISSLATWNGRIYASGYGGPPFFSEDAGRTWTQSSESTFSLVRGPWVDAGDTLATVVQHEDANIFATSTDGITWEQTTLSGDASSLSRLVTSNDELYGITRRGAVGRMNLEGDWTQVTGPRDDFISRIRDVEPLADGFVILTGSVARQWSPSSGWQTLEYGLRSQDVSLGAGHAWLSGFQLLRLDEDGWTLATPRDWPGYDILGGTRDDVYYADGIHCIYRRGEQQWDFVAQWADGRIYDDCDGNRAAFGDLSGVAALGDDVFISKVAAVGHLPGGPAGGGLMSLDQLSPVDEGFENVRTLTTTADRLWLIRDYDLYSSDGTSIVGETDALASDTGRDIKKVLTVAASDDHVYARILTHDDQTELAYRSDQTWKLAPRLEVDDLFELAAYADGVWSVSEGRAWNYAPGADRWREVSEGLPADAQVKGVKAGAAGVFATVEDQGVWQLVAE